jgi:hypothetical protein
MTGELTVLENEINSRLTDRDYTVVSVYPVKNTSQLTLYKIYYKRDN